MIEVWRVGPDEEFMSSQVPGGRPMFIWRWVAELSGATVGEARYFFGWTAKRAVKKALAYERAVARSRASRQVIE